MKCCGFKTSVFLIQFLCCVKYATSILCYDCNSLFDPRCGEEFDSFSLGVVNCSLKDPLEHLPDVESTVCRTIKMEIQGKIRVVRQCGYLTDQREQPCHRQSGTGDLFTTYCTCNTDLCNAGNVPVIKPAVFGVFILVSLII